MADGAKQICIFLLAREYNVNGVVWDIFEEHELCNLGDTEGDLCDDGNGICSGTLIRDPWTGDCYLTCIEGKSCYPLPPIPNGQAQLVDEDNCKLGAYANVTCNPGYSTSEPKFLRCGVDRNWYPDPTECCQPIECDLMYLPYLQNGQWNVLDNTYGGYAVGSCDVSHSSSVGVIISQCLADGTWSQLNGSCDGLFCDVNQLPGGFVLQGDGSVGTTALLECSDGEEIVGCAYAVCLSNLTWTEDVGQCVPECCPPPCIANGYVDTDNSSDGVVYCNPGFELVDTTIDIECDLATKTWPDTSNLCQPTNCTDPLPTDPYGTSYIESDHINPGAVVNIDCSLGYQSSTMEPITSVCQDDGTWGTPDGTCEKIFCPNTSLPTTDDGEFVIQGDGSYDTDAQLMCDTNYRLVGIGTVSCNIDGSWDKSDAKCEPECCPPPCIANGYVDTDGSLSGVVHCNPGFELVDTTIDIECDLTMMTWPDTSNLCQPTNCTDPLPTDPYGTSYIESDHINPGAVVNIDCSLGYQSSTMEPITSVCQDDGTWGTPDGTCEKIFCPNTSLPTTDDGQFVIQGDGSYDTDAQLICNTNYRLVGIGTVSCNIDGSWDKSDAKCELECCGIPCVENGVVTLDPSNSSVGILTCDIDYIVNPDNNLQCDFTSGDWIDLENVCIDAPTMK